LIQNIDSEIIDKLLKHLEFINDSQEKTSVFSGAPQNSESILKGDKYIILENLQN
jgi:hypothetical protein